MLLDDWNQEEYVEVMCEEAREEGLSQGREEGMEKERQYFLELLDQGLSAEEIRQQLQKLRRY